MFYTLITGACGGLGQAFVQELAQKGCPLLLTGRSEDRLQSLCDQLKQTYPDLPVAYKECDLTDSQSREDLFAYIDECAIQLERLIYVAGVDIQKAFSDYTQEKLQMQLRVNFEGAVSLAHSFLSRVQQDGSPEILAIGSVSGIYPMPYFALYSATKKALEQFFYALHVELKGKVKVTCVLPGAIPTREDIRENIKTQGLWGKLAAKSPQAVAKASLKAVKKNKRKVIIGFWNKLMRFFTALIPLRIKAWFIARRWSKTQKDVF